MNQQLIPIIAAYWGAECSYECHVAEDWYIKADRAVYSEFLRELEYKKHRNFKLHLRPLWSITEDELRELGEALGLKDMDINLNGIDEFWRVLPAKQIFANINEDYFTVYEDNTFDLGFGKDYTKIINHLRAKGFCVDQELVDANLVEWKEVKP